MLNHYAQVPSGPGGTRHFSLARHLPAFGWRATIVAASVDHMTGRQRLEPGRSRLLEDVDGVPFLWLRTREHAGNGVNRLLNMMDFTRAALAAESAEAIEPPDAIIGSSVHPFAAWAGRRLARRYKVPFIFEVRDLWPQSLIDIGRISPWHPLTVLLRRLELSLYRSAHAIIILMPGAADYIRKLGIPPEKIVWIPNGVEIEPNVLPKLKVKDSPFTLMYLGAHGEANGLDNVLRAMKMVEARLGHDAVELRLVGDGPRKPALMELSRELSLRGVRFHDPVPKSSIPSVIAEADALIFNLVDAPVFKYGISSNKLFDYLAAERPVIFAANAANNPVAEAGAGLSVAADDPEALAAAIAAMAAIPEADRVRMGKAGREYVARTHGVQALAEKLAGVLDESLARR